MTDQVYSFVLESKDKISGNNNSATFNILFSILPREYKYYKVAFSFITQPAFFVDSYSDTTTITYSSQCGRITTNLLLQSSMKTDNSPSTTLGFVYRNISTQNATLTNGICYITANPSVNAEIVVLRPDVDQISVNIFSGVGNTPLVSTNNLGTVSAADLPGYILILQFTPVKDYHAQR
jgi:hypothetical protein